MRNYKISIDLADLYIQIKELDLIDNIVDEPLGGAHRDMDKMAANLKQRIKQDLTDLRTLSKEELLDKRYARLMAFGYL